MRGCLAIALLVSLGATAPAAELPPACAGCPAPRDLKAALRAFERGLKLHKSGRTGKALAEFERAARLAPRDPEYVQAREVARQAAVRAHLQAGNQLLEAERPVEAQAEFRAALNLDPSSEAALQHLGSPFAEGPAGPLPAISIAVSEEPRLAPQPGTRDFHFRGNSRTLLTSVAQAFGLEARLDESVPPTSVRFDLERADLSTALSSAARVTRTFWFPLGERQVMFAAESVENRNQLEPVALRSFRLPQGATQQELNELAAALRVLFDLRFITIAPQNSALVVRAPVRTLDAVTRFLKGLDTGRPQLLLDVKVFQVSRTTLRQLGIGLPLQFQMFNLPAAALALPGGSSLQDLINQLISTGQINQAGNQAVAALLQQLQLQQSSVFSQPFASFGGGITRFGLTIPASTATAAFNRSSLESLEHVTVRTAHGDSTTVRVGSRFPILNAIFSPIFNTSSVSQVLANNSFQAPFPSFNFEELGLTLKASPQARGEREVTLKLELQIRSLEAASFNGVPLLNNREYSGTITVANGEPAVVAGLISRSDQLSLRGLPGVGRLPAIGRLASNEQKQVEEDELLITITPYSLTSSSRTHTTLVLAP